MGTPKSPDAQPGPDLVLSITPEPTADERDAVVAALTILFLEPSAPVAGPATREMPSRWARAGREAALRSRLTRCDWRVR
jgi:hypothetical protein